MERDKKPEEEEEPFGGEIPVRPSPGGTPRLLGWTGYVLYVWAVVYLLIHPPIQHRPIILVFAGIIGAWLLFYAITRRPSEL